MSEQKQPTPVLTSLLLHRVACTPTTGRSNRRSLERRSRPSPGTAGCQGHICRCESREAVFTGFIEVVFQVNCMIALSLTLVHHWEGCNILLRHTVHKQHTQKWTVDLKKQIHTEDNSLISVLIISNNKVGSITRLFTSKRCIYIS